ncbi:MAG: 4Fe-4S dicluster domain-containing protein [Dethiobacter sp.]|jgi:2-oxoglutarate ferredoxin oxidoreductase subunit delta|nr:MAG: 4Fe-4S dicluster domain-containing protein [Dethiobacter sp.]
MSSEKSRTTIERVKINEAWCKGCGICVEYCPKKVFEMREGKSAAVRPENCALCGLCQLRCPDFAIELEEKDND